MNPSGSASISAHTKPMKVHPTAVIDARARVPASCVIGPYCVIGAEVELGENCRLLSHVAIEGPTKIGSDNSFFPFCAIGMAPQDVTYRGEPTRLEIGDHNEIRECVTIIRGTLKGGGGCTRVGSHSPDHGLCAHRARHRDRRPLHAGERRDACRARDRGRMGDGGALCPVHQFCVSGAHAYIGGGTTITQDVLPFS